MLPLCGSLWMNNAFYPFKAVVWDKYSVPFSEKEHKKYCLIPNDKIKILKFISQLNLLCVCQLL